MRRQKKMFQRNKTNARKRTKLSGDKKFYPVVKGSDHKMLLELGKRTNEYSENSTELENKKKTRDSIQ